LPGYILPAVPPLALLFANKVRSNLRYNSPLLRWTLLATGLALVIFGIALQQQAPRIPAFSCVSPVCGITRIWVLAVGGGALVSLLAGIRKLHFGLFTAILVILLMVIEIDRFLPNLDPGVSARDAIRVATDVWPDFKAQSAGAWQLNRSYIYQLSYYTREEIPAWKSGESAPKWLFVPKGRQTEAEGLGFHCVNFAVYPAVIPCRIVASTRGLGGSPGSGNGGSRLHNR
jgi:hypothetical protein